MTIDQIIRLEIQEIQHDRWHDQHGLFPYLQQVFGDKECVGTAEAELGDEETRDERDARQACILAKTLGAVLEGHLRKLLVGRENNVRIKPMIDMFCFEFQN